MTGLEARAGAVAIARARDGHTAGIVAIERAAAPGSLLAVAGAATLEEARSRGHGVLVAVDNAGGVVGWAWSGVEYERGEHVGHVYRVSVQGAWRRRGVATALLAAAREALAGEGATSLRVSVPQGDAVATAFFASQGLGVSAVSMECAL